MKHILRELQQNLETNISKIIVRRFSVGDLACANLGIFLHYLNVEKYSNRG